MYSSPCTALWIFFNCSGHYCASWKYSCVFLLSLSNILYTLLCVCMRLHAIVKLDVTFNLQLRYCNLSLMCTAQHKRLRSDSSKSMRSKPFISKFSLHFGIHLANTHSHTQQPVENSWKNGSQPFLTKLQINRYIRRFLNVNVYFCKTFNRYLYSTIVHFYT